MKMRYVLHRADHEPVTLDVDPRDPSTLSRLAAAIVRLQGRERAAVRITSRLVDCPEHISGPLNLILSDIEAARAANAPSKRAIG